MAVNTFKGYDNFIIENKIESILATKLDMAQFFTTDYSLTENEGMTKKIHTYTGSGAAETLGRGDGLTAYCDASFVEAPYTVHRVQAGTRYYDDDAMTDSTWVDTKIKTVSEAMVNEVTSSAINEWKKTLNTCAFTDYKLGNFADAIANYRNEYEEDNNLMFICSIDLVPTIQKALGEQLIYVEAYVRTGYIGSILSTPLYFSKALPAKTMYMITKDAVTNFMKKGVFVETDRDIDTKLNRIIAARYNVVALTDMSKCYECGAAQATDATVTTATKATTSVAGAATTGASVQAYVNGKAAGNPATAASSAYTCTVPTLAAGDKVYVVATLSEKIKSVSAEFTVEA